MTFHWPHALWFLLLPLALTLLELRRHRRAAATAAHPKILRAEAGPARLTLDTAAPKPAARLRWRLALGLALATLALARPQWGRLDEPVFDQSRDIIIALDLSRSMLAEDVRPSRLARAKLLVSSLLERLAGERVGLIIFAGTAFLQSPLSADYEILRDLLPTLDPAYLPQGGSNYEALLKTSLDSFAATASSDRYLIILSDGEATDDHWKPHAAELKAKSIRVLGLGIGTAAGAMIPDGTGAYVKDDRGAVVLSRLENSTLQELAATTNGAYRDASAWVDLAQLIDSTVATGTKGEFRERNRIRLAERYQWALAPALLLFLWSLWREFPVRPRLREVKLQTPNPKPQTPTSTPPPPVGRGVPAEPPPIENRKSKIKNSVSPSALQPFSLSLLLLITYTLPLTTDLPAAEKEDPTVVAEPLAKLVARFSARDTLAARDYAELARTTLTYGQRLQSSQRPVPEGPIHDALAAVDAGQTLDPKTADWAALRRDLETLLRKPEPPPEEKKDQPQNQQQKQQEKQPQNPQKKQDQQQSEQQKKEQEQKSEPQKSDSSQQEKQPPKNDPAGQPPSEPQTENPKPAPPPPDPQQTQKIGGTPDKKPADTKDSALAVPLQKLDQLRDQDSPVKLQLLMQGEAATPPTTGKNW